MHHKVSPVMALPMVYTIWSIPYDTRHLNYLQAFSFPFLEKFSFHLKVEILYRIRVQIPVIYSYILNKSEKSFITLQQLCCILPEKNAEDFAIPYKDSIVKTEKKHLVTAPYYMQNRR